MRDVVVVGAGPAGCRAAALLSPDRDVMVLEEHDVPGSPVQCTGLITDEVIRMSGVRPDILSTISGAHVLFPGGGRVTVRSRSHFARLIDRGSFDGMMADAAASAGAEFAFGTRYGRHSLQDGHVSIETSAGNIRSRLLIGADGHSSATALSLTDNGPAEYIRGIQVDVRSRCEEDDTMTLRLGSAVAPGFFSWEIPFGDFTRVGLCTEWSAGPPKTYLSSLLRISGLADREVIRRYSGKIPIGGRRRTYGERMLLIGDAAGQVKPVSGGGLYPAFKAAPFLKEAADRAFSSENFSPRSLSRYEKGWKGEIGRELRRGYALRKMYRKMSDGDLDRAGRVLCRPRARHALGDLDLDHPSSVAREIAKDVPALVGLMPLALKGLL
ncbi:MAG: NAD(P)/FAD-dependent oxidoreductase [Candidatus Methanomethylophilaceae archaeon]|jgi:geranylgeranyl reductase family protein|nr:NAD(P)/FAD-dependent oxidoreductase [Candidatus Methanomethylophilaceae archaeon]NLF33615.1 NAD(P)/FAD-dependent oxidoreductase [Thermoplasmatales archaeon]